MLILGYLLAVLMGLTLGLIGAGGSILTVPILVYFFKVPPLIAAAYSLLIVGCAALVGAYFYYRENLVKVKPALIFAIPATISVFCTRLLLVPNIPEKILTIPKDVLVMLLFSILMLLASIFMFRPLKIKEAEQKSRFCKICVLILGSAGIGLLTGIVGVGGGFLIIPALVILFNLSMKEAIGTSLTIIAVNSLIGFNGDLLSGLKVDRDIIYLFLPLTISGMLFGVFLSKKFDSQKLKKIFATFVLIIAISIFTSEINQLINL